MEWNDASEDLINGYIENAMHRASQHDIAGKRHKIYNIIGSTPGIIVPIIIGGLESHIDPITSSVLLIFSGVVCGINSLMNFANRSRNHLEASSRYDEFVNDNRRVLVMTRQFRPPCDVSLMQSTNTINRYMSDSPPI